MDTEEHRGHREEELLSPQHFKKHLSQRLDQFPGSWGWCEISQDTERLMWRWMNRDRVVGRQVSQTMPRAERKEDKQAG